jgi:hypothetical protein
MERGSAKHGPQMDDQIDSESESIQRAKNQESRSEEDRLKEEDPEEPGSGHRIAGSGSSAEGHSWSDHGEEGGASHPKPKEDDR